MEKKKFKLGLLPKLLIAIVLGIIIGQFFPVWFCRVVVTASSIFSSFLKFIIPLMIVAYVTMGDCGSEERRRQAAAHHGCHRLLLDPDCRLGFVLCSRHPVPATS